MAIGSANIALNDSIRIINAVSEACMLVDAEGKILYNNTACEVFILKTGLNPVFDSEDENRSIYSFFDEEQKKQLEPLLKQAASDTPSQQKVVWGFEKKSMEFSLQLAALQSSILVIFREKMDDEKVNYVHGHGIGQDFLRLVIDLVPHRIFARDSEGNYLLANKTLANSIGKKVEEVIGKNLIEIHPIIDEAKVFFEEDRRVLEKKEPLVISDQIVTDAQFVEKVFQTIKIPFLIPNSTKWGVLGVSNDITDFVKARKDAEYANKAKSIFLANISHEIRTPMNGIFGLLQIFEETRLDSLQMEYVRDMKYSAENLLKIISGILDFSKIEAGKTDFVANPFEVRKLVGFVVAFYKTKADKKGLNFSYYIDPQIPVVLVGDSIHVNQILNNLIDNAIKYTESGSVTLHVLFDPEKTLQNTKNSESPIVHLLFSIMDTGIGFPMEKAEYIFESFAQLEQKTTRESAGTGLGLPISKLLVQKMGGHIKVESEVGKGSTFTVSLPFRTAVQYAVDLTSTSTLFVERNDENGFWDKLHILIVEDEEITQKLLKLILTQKGCTVYLAANGSKALELWQTQPLHVILMDIRMPYMDGLKTTTVIRQKELETKKHIPILGISAFGIAEAEEEAIRAGMDGFLSKPVNKSELFERIEKLLKSEIFPYGR